MIASASEGRAADVRASPVGASRRWSVEIFASSDRNISKEVEYSHIISGIH